MERARPGPVERIRLGPGLEISRVLIGLWQVADQERSGTPLDPEAAAGALEPLADAGFGAFDVADHYGTAEVIAGALRRRRPEARVLTKWVPEPGVSSRREVAAAVGRSLDRIGVDRLDLLQFHAWSYADPTWLDCLFHLTALRDEGRILHLGVTNFDAAHLDLALRSGIPLVSNQVCCSLLDRRAAGAMRAVCREHGVRLLAYGTLAGGLLSDRFLGAPAPRVTEALPWSQLKYHRFIEQAGGWERFQRLLRAARRVADRFGVSLANVAVRHALEQPAVAGVIVGARPGESSHLEDNRRVFEFSLDDRSREELAEAQAELDPIPGDCGDEYRRPPYLTASGDLRHHVSHFPPPYPARTTGRGRELVEEAGFREAVRVGDRIRIGGATPEYGGRLLGGESAAAQTRFALDRIEGALGSLGAGVEDIIRVRVLVRDRADADTARDTARAVLGERVPEVRIGAGTGTNRRGLPARRTGIRVELELEAEAGRSS